MDGSTEHGLARCDNYASFCRLLFSVKWRFPIMQLLAQRSMRLSELRRAIPSSTKKMLIDNLHALEELKWIARVDRSTVKQKWVEYTISPLYLERFRRIAAAAISSDSTFEPLEKTPLETRLDG